MSDKDDDDGVDPQIEDVNGYYFEDDEEEPVCFSILPFQFGENDNEADFFRKNVVLRGFADKSPQVYEKVVAWKIRFDSDQPNIYVLSTKHKWIKLLKPRKSYGDSVRSILITVQMLHFVRRGGQRSCLNHLWDHLDEVFGKYNSKPAKGDLMKHDTLINLFVEKDQTLMKSKMLQRLIKNGFERTKKRRVRKSDDNKDDSGDDWDDGDGSSDDDDDSSHDDGTDQICAICDDGGNLLSCKGPCKRSFHPTKKDGRESKCETLGYTSAEVKRISNYLCANCKNKQHQCFRCGELEPSHGPNAKVFQCNQASCGYFYHPKCIASLLDPDATDGELERRIMAGMPFSCPIHWCFNCGRMENKTQGALQLAACRRCPKAYHSDPEAYHSDCLPREIFFPTNNKDGQPRAWKLFETIFIYCLDHEIDKDTGAPSRNHIKFPATPECTKTKELGNSKVRMIGKRRKNTNQSTKPVELSNRLCGAESEQADNVGAKNTSPQIVLEPHCAAKRLKDDPQIEQGKRIKNTNQSTKHIVLSNRCGAESEQADNVGAENTSPQIVVEPHCAAKRLKDDPQIQQGKRRKNTNLSTKPIELSNRLCGAESEQADNVGSENTSPQIVVEPYCAAKRLKDDPQIEQSIIGAAASQNDAETMKGHEKQFGISSGAASTETEKRVTCLAQKGTCLGTPYDGPSTKDMSDCSVQDTSMDKDVELENVACRITEDKYANGRKKTQEDYTRKETAQPKDLSKYQGQTQNDVQLDNLCVEIQAVESPLEPGNKRDKDRQENVYELGSASGQEKETSSRRENPGSDRGMFPRNDSKIVDYRKDGTTVDNVDDHSLERSYACQGQWSRSNCNDFLVAIDQDTSSDKSKKRSQPVEKASDGNKTDLDNKKHNLIEDGRDAHYEEARTERNTAADTSGYKCRDNTQSDRREEPVGRNTRARSREHSPERQRRDHVDSHYEYRRTERNTAVDTSKYKCRDKTQSDRREEPVGRNTRARSREHSPERQTMDHSDSHYEDRRTERNTAAGTSKYKCRDKTQSDRREEPVGRNSRARSREHSGERQRMDCGDSYPGTYNKQRCEWPHNVNSSRSGDDGSQWSPCQSSFPTLPEFGGDRPHLYPRDSQYRTSGRHNPPQYLGIPQYYRPNTAASVAEHSLCYQLAGGYGEGSRSSRPVTDMYAPHLERTNYQPRRQSDLQYDPRLVEALHNRNLF